MSDNSELKKKASEYGFTNEHIDKSVKLGMQMTSHAIRSYLHYVVKFLLEEEGKMDEFAEFDNLIEKLPNVTPVFRQEVSVKGGGGVRICLEVGIVPKDTPFDLCIPNNIGMKQQKEIWETIRTYIKNFNILSNEMYKKIMSDHIVLYNALSTRWKSINWSSFSINEFNNTLAFNEKFDKRIGVLIYYLNANGELVKY